MKALARSHVWWPGMEQQIEQMAQQCEPCQSLRNRPAPTTLHPWTWLTCPWQRLHIDFTGPFLGKSFLIIVDAHSKWPEVIPMMTTTAEKTIAECLPFMVFLNRLYLIMERSLPLTCFSNFLERMELNISIRHHTIHLPIVRLKDSCRHLRMP